MVTDWGTALRAALVRGFDILPIKAPGWELGFRLNAICKEKCVRVCACACVCARVCACGGEWGDECVCEVCVGMRAVSV